LAHALGWAQAALLTHPEHILSATETNRFETMLSRREASEPMQYILGSQEFFGLRFEVSPAVLIPRPETEHLVEAVLERFGRNAAPHIVDVGTGSGAIAIALAHEMPNAHITAVDCSLPALAVAQRNALQHGVAERVTFLESDLLGSVKENDFDAVVSNPPYIANEEALEPQVFHYEPHAALFAGPTGIEIYERLIPQALGALKPHGWLIVEIGHGQQAALERLLDEWKAVSFLPDLQGIPRVVLAQKRGGAL
jgi:release factor glutamine methyltransferase